MLGAPDPLYVAARRALLDAFEAVQEHLDAIVVVGAQAVYAHTGEADLAVAPHTTDGDLAIDPARLHSEPLLEELLKAGGFRQSPDEVGVWAKDLSVEGVPRTVVVDFLVPESLGGPGRRAARIPPHDKRSARKVAGLDGTLVDNELGVMEALESGDSRRFEVSIAGPSALVVAKVFKINDRTEAVGRLADKDALDVFRLLRAVPTADFARGLEVLRSDERSRSEAEQALVQFDKLFGRPGSLGCRMASRAAAPLESEDEIRESTAALAQDLLREI